MSYRHVRRLLCTACQKYFFQIPTYPQKNADLVTERERQLTTARANQTTGLTNGVAAN